MNNLTLLFGSMFLAVNALCFQPEFEEFRALEERVKYTHPDSLKIYAQTLDTNEVFGKAFYHWSLGKSFYWNSKYPSAYQALEKASNWIRETGNKVLLAEVYLDLSSSLAVVDKYGRALSYVLEANELISQKGSEQQKITMAISLGELYRKIGQHKDALAILKETLPKTEDFSYSRARCLNRLAAVYSETGRWDNSLQYSYRSLEIANALGDLDLIATSENEIGYALRHKGRLREALEHFFKADSLWQSLRRLRYAANPMHHISVVYRSLNEFEKGLIHTREAYSLIKGKGWDQIEMNIHDDLKMYHTYFGNEDSVLFYDRERLQAAINFRTKQFEVNTKMVEILYTQKENEQTIREQNIKLKNEALEKEAMNRERTTLWVTVSLIAVILIIIFFYAFNQRRLQKRLSQENAAKEKKNEELLIALGANEALVQEISHRVKNNLAVLAGLLSMQANRSDNNEVKKELKDSVLRIESIATIHKKLYDKRSDAKVNLNEALHDLCINVVASMGQDPTTCLELYLDDVEIDIAEAVTLCLIINEAITNSCKYAEVSPAQKIIVELKHSQEKIICRVIDHGPGFDTKKVKENADSLGLYLIKLLSRQLRAQTEWRKQEEQFILSIELEKR